MSLAVFPIGLALAIPMLAQNTPSAPLRTFSEMRDRYRPLLIFAPVADPRTSEQVHLLTSHRADLIDRQIMLVPALHPLAGAGDREVVTVLPNDEPALRKRFHIQPDDFTVILLGKDGGEKFRAHTPVTIEQLNQIIDAMPMRRQEIAHRAGSRRVK